MSDTQDAPHEQQAGPRVTRDDVRDLSRLRRSASDSYIAGVAGGLGRHFDVDPTVIRVVLAVLTLFGGAGIIVYVAVWLLVPEDGHERAPIDLNGDVVKALLLSAAVVAGLVAFGAPFFDTGWGSVPLLAVCVLGLVAFVLARRDRRTDRAAHRNQPPPPWAPVTPTAGPTEGPTMSTTDTQVLETGTPPPAWMPPPPPAYVPPPRPRRTGLVLFWPTLALIAIGWGTLGILDAGMAVSPTAYVALALAITAAMLVVGAFVARPGGLIALGLLLSLGLGVSSAVEASTDWETGGASVTYRPVSAAEVRDVYSVPNGEIDLDLSGVMDLTALNDRTVEVRLNAGEIDVTVPRGLNVEVAADIAFAGEIDIAGTTRGGLDVSRELTLPGTSPSAPTLYLDIDARVGQINVNQE